MILKEIEFQALEYPLPDADRAKLIELGKAARKARADAGPRVVATEEGSALADFEAVLRNAIGVRHRREWLVRGGAT